MSVLERKRLAIAGVWMVSLLGTGYVALTASIGQAANSPEIRCADGEYMVSIIAESDESDPGYSTPKAALAAFLERRFGVQDSSGTTQFDDQRGRSLLAITESDRTQLMASFSHDSYGWKLEASDICTDLLTRRGRTK